ncbi:MAG: signal recognition particle-docking protein FtsY [Candidatus Thermoplasmatota archaeon]|jgi:fused signal recognition particle receptor|nr:signal recognition particle-docking protein FtsY [Candidatus Thermoplasmatota archaeon]
MFNFLKKKLKKFEDQLEAELQTELKKEEKKSPSIMSERETKPVIKEKPEEKKIAEKALEKAVQPLIKELTKIEKKYEEKLAEREKARIEKLRREEELDKQIEKSIETELEHTLRTRRSIEEVVKAETKPSVGISGEKLDDLLWELEVGLLESDVAYSVIESIKRDIKEELKNASFDRGKIGDVVENVLRNAIAHVLKYSEIDFNDLIEKRKKPVVIMFVGVNGSGKTLAIAKIAYMLKKQGKSCVMAAGDTFRAGAIEQLETHAKNLDVKLIKHGPGADPAAVAYDAIEHAKAKHKDVVLLDTAGRMQTNVNLMDEMAKIKRVAKPDMIIFVGDALSGNDAVEQAKRFNEVVGIDGVILTKVDTDAKGGSALSVAYTIGKPLFFIGIGQGYEDQIPFNPQWMLDKIFSE